MKKKINPKNKCKLWVSSLNIERFSVGEYNSTFYWISECILSMLEGVGSNGVGEAGWRIFQIF